MAEPIAPVDTSVSIPSSVRAAAAAADAAYKAAYPQSEPPKPGADAAATPPAAPPAAAAAAGTEPQPPAAAAPSTPSPQTPQATPAEPDWEQRYNSMKGRWDQSQRTIGSMQAQMQELGDEVMRLQQFLTNPQQRQPQAQSQAQLPPLITPEDKEKFGDELLDVMQRAARAAVAPDLARIGQGVNQVAQRVVQGTKQHTFEMLDRLVPNWRGINIDPRFVAWASSPDVYSGVLRSQMLNAAIQAGDASRAAAFFEGFLREEQATGHQPAPQASPPQQPAPAQTPAISLESLTAPGGAKPAPGDHPPVPADKPIITRPQIAAFYRDLHRGVYTGREDEKNRIEQEIFAAQREGRVRG